MFIDSVVKNDTTVGERLFKFCFLRFKIRSMKLLKECVKLIMETAQEPFALQGPVKAACSTVGREEYSILREFPLVVTPEMQALMHFGPDEVIDGVCNLEHEIIITIEATYIKSRFKGNYMEPPDPDEFEFEDWTPVFLDGLELSSVDATTLKQRLDPLTLDELSRVEEQMAEDAYEESDWER